MCKIGWKTWIYKCKNCNESNCNKLKRPIPRYIIVKLLKNKDKERILKAGREKRLVTYKQSLIRLFLIRNLGGQRALKDIIKGLKEEKS